MSTLSELTDRARHLWPLSLVLAIAARAVIGLLFSRRAARDRQKLGQEISRLRCAADRAEQERERFELEIRQLVAGAERHQRADAGPGSPDAND